MDRLDEVDFAILRILIQDAKTPYTEVGKKLNISSGTVHVRMRKLEKAGIVRVAHRANSGWSYLSSMHTAHSRRHRMTASVRAWGYFNEFSTWAFLFMTLSGLYMWIATRPGMLWAQVSLGGAAALMLALWLWIR